MRIRKVIGIVIILLGIGILCYPTIRQAYTKERQNELKEAFYEILDENKQLITPTITVGPPTEYVPSDPVTIQPTKAVAVEEHEEIQQDSQNSSNLKDRLKGQTVLGLIEIEQLDLLYAIVEGTDTNNLGVAIGHMSETADLGEIGNCVLAGHRGGVTGPYFKDIDQLSNGDKICITNLTGKEYIYQVTESFLVDPSDLWVADNVDDQRMLTLITCQNHATKRLIVRAVCKE